VTAGRAAASLLIASAAACADGTAREPSASMRDSAGVRIVENTGVDAASALGWRVDEPPAVDLGGGDAEPILTQVTGATRLSDGSIVVASAGTHRLEVFAADGGHVRSIGREGEGPGEFRSIFFVGRLAGDTIAAWDPLLGRLSVFGPGGELVRVANPGPVLDAPFPRVHGVLPDGRFVVAAGGGGVPVPGRAARDTLDWLLLDPAGATAARLGRFPGAEQIAHVDGTGMLLRPLPFGLSTVAAVHGDALYVASGDRYEVSVYGMDGAVRTRIRGDRPRLAVTRRDIEAYRRELVTIGGDAAARRRQAELLDAAPYPETMPALTGLEVDAEGNVWVQDSQPPGEDAPQTWTVFAPDGRLRGTVLLPHGLRVAEIGPGWILALALDADGGEHVRLYRIHKGQRGDAGSRASF
jgi:hypothetical protein